MGSYDFSKAFGITELRDHMFAFADNASLARCSQVCSVWSDSALSLLWEEMKDVSPLFKILSPMSSQSFSENRITNYRLVFCGTVDSIGAWRRFMSYGARIRRFTLSWSSIRSLSDSAINEVARKRPTLSITPNLQKLFIRPTGLTDADVMNFSLLLLHDSLDHISVGIPQNKVVFSAFIDQLLLRAPTLQSLELRVDIGMSVNNFNGVLSKSLPQLNDLRELRVPYYALTHKIIRAFRWNAKLETIAFHDGPAHITSEDPNLPLLDVTSYSSLTELQIACSFSQLVPFIAAGCFWEHLASLKLQVPLLTETARSLSALLSSLTRDLPLLARLTVDGIPQGLDFEYFRRETMTVSCTTLEPITNMKRLVEFSISWPAPFKISNSELESLSSQIPRIEKLSLNSSPVVIDENPELTLDVLPALSRSCPNLRSLALFVDCVAVPSYNASVFASPDSQTRLMPLSKLKEIDFGLSPVGRDEHMFSMCLSKVLPRGCRFKCENSWLSGVEDIVEGNFVGFKENRWSGKYKSLEALTKTLITARYDERHYAFVRIRELELRIRTLEALKKTLRADGGE